MTKIRRILKKLIFIKTKFSKRCNNQTMRNESPRSQWGNGAVLLLCIISLILITVPFIEVLYYFNTATGMQKYVCRVWNVDVYVSITDTKFSNMLKQNKFEVTGEDHWVLDRSYNIISRHSPHWHYHGIITEADRMGFIITNFYQNSRHEQYIVSNLVLQWFNIYTQPSPSFLFEDFVQDQDIIFPPSAPSDYNNYNKYIDLLYKSVSNHSLLHQEVLKEEER